MTYAETVPSWFLLNLKASKLRETYCRVNALKRNNSPEDNILPNLITHRLYLMTNNLAQVKVMLLFALMSTRLSQEVQTEKKTNSTNSSVAQNYWFNLNSV